MSVSASDIKYYAPLNLPSDDTSTLGGGIDTSAEWSGATTSEALLQRAANAAGGAAKTDYSKMHIKNTHATDDAGTTASPCVVYIDNYLKKPASSGTFTIVSSSASDTGTLNLRYRKADGNFITDAITLTGTTQVTSGYSCYANSPVSAEYASGAVGDITITNSITLGKIPAGGKTANSAYSIAIETALNDTTTTTNRLTAPGGMSFTSPNTPEDGLAVANSGVLTAGDSQGIWLKRTLEAGQNGLSDSEFGVHLSWV